jgi:alpha-galactosidase
MREALGPEAYLLACGAPILPSLGLCDALRVGPDVAPFWENKRDAHLLCNPTTPGVKNAIRTTLNRLWLAPLVHTDPDVAFFRRLNSTLTPAQSALLQDLARICNFKTTSDLPQWWTEAERQTVRAFLEQQSTVERTGRATFRLDRREVDFSAAVDVPLVRKKTFSLPFILWGSEQRWILRLMEDSDNARYEQLKQGL